MHIVDGQVHIWAASTPARPWPAKHSRPHRSVPFSVQDLLSEMVGAGVDRAVLVPPTWEGYRNDLALEAARLHPKCFAVMGRLDLTAPGARSQLANWKAQPGMLGLRLARDQRLDDEGWDWLCADAQKHGIPFMLNALPAELAAVGQVAQRYPELKLTIDHLAVLKGKKDDAAFAEVDKLLALAKHPNVAVKASSMPTYTDDNFPFRRLYPHLRRVYDAFGPKRMFWGSDLTKLPCPYRQAVSMFTEGIPWLTAEDKEWIMGRGLCEWIGWKVP